MARRVRRRRKGPRLERLPLTPAQKRRLKKAKAQFRDAKRHARELKKLYVVKSYLQAYREVHRARHRVWKAGGSPLRKRQRTPEQIASRRARRDSFRVDDAQRIGIHVVYNGAPDDRDAVFARVLEAFGGAGEGSGYSFSEDTRDLYGTLPYDVLATVAQRRTAWRVLSPRSATPTAAVSEHVGAMLSALLSNIEVRAIEISFRICFLVEGA